MNLSRDELKQHFLAHAGFKHVELLPIPGDASFRTYDRAVCDGAHYIVMNAPPPQEDIRPFVKVANFLCAQQFSAPKLHAHDETHGFILLEDFGNEKFNARVAQEPAQELEYYKRAMDVLLALRAVPVPQGFVPPYDMTVLLREMMLLPEWYYPWIHKKPIDAAVKDRFEQLCREALADIATRREVLVLRDYHADNLMLLDDRTGHQAIGLLDFQDALHGAAAYDIVSLLEDARRDVPLQVQQRALTYYIQQAGLDAEQEQQLRSDYALLGAQRNIKILGIFARLIQRDNKPHYAQYMPRLWGYLAQDLALPALADIHVWLSEHFAEQMQVSHV